MSGVSKRCDGTSGELTLVSKRSEDGGEGVALPRSMSEAVGIAIYGVFCIHLCQSEPLFPSVQPTALEKPSSTYCPNENVKSNDRRR